MTERNISFLERVIQIWMLDLYSTTLILNFTKGLNQPMLTGVASRGFYFANYLMVFLKGG